MSNITPFFFKGHNVTVISDDDGSLHFVAMELAEVLDYSDAEALTRRLDDDEKQNRQIVGFGNRGVTIISESGLYAAILGSTKPEAKPFQKWVRSEVLPSIRKTGGYSMAVSASEKMQSRSGLPEFRRARALDLATKTAERIVAQFPNLSEQSRQTVFAKVINPVAGTEILALPHVEHKTYSAEKVGEKLGISGNMVGRIANAHGLKTDEYGRYQLDKSRHSSKQVEAFVYNDMGVEAIKRHLGAETSNLAPKRQQPGKPFVGLPARQPQPQEVLL
ncbi:BRO family protein [Pantoea sp. 18069]|uniref:BRO-N domain-containing protein n=1 Tax=Pantoea sp. 18069 TaxID=2681415 RepID=UPI0013589C0B|nr:BRO family protein [Pantoea sp. 18069]